MDSLEYKLKRLESRVDLLEERLKTLAERLGYYQASPEPHETESIYWNKDDE